MSEKIESDTRKTGSAPTEEEEKIKNLLMKAERIEMPKDYFTTKPQRRLKLNYAMIRFLTAKIEKNIGFKITQDDPKVFFNASYIKDKQQIDLHLRMPVFDEWHNLVDYVDIDLYFPATELNKILELTE